MTALQAAAGRLERILIAENAALQAMDLDALPGLLLEKTAAAAELEAAVPGLSTTSTSTPSTSTLSPSAPGLQAQAGRVRTLAAENRRLLERAILVQDRVLRLVASAAREAGLRDAARYGAAGQPRPDHTAIALQTRA